MGSFLNRFTGKTSFYFMNRNYFIMASSVQKYPHPRWEVRQIMKIAPFSVKPLITVTFRDSLINPVTNKFYFVIFKMRVANETGCESLIYQ